jgi:hypothetical protein
MMELRLSQSLFTDFSFSEWNFTRRIIWGKTLFIYITKSIYIGSASLKIKSSCISYHNSSRRCYDCCYANTLSHQAPSQCTTHGLTISSTGLWVGDVQSTTKSVKTCDLIALEGPIRRTREGGVNGSR